jgi:hypothetical protein
MREMAKVDPKMIKGFEETFYNILIEQKSKASNGDFVMEKAYKAAVDKQKSRFES